jgi:heptosyltransferase-2
MHIASAVNKRIISIFGPTNPSRKAPMHETSVSIWKDDDKYDDSYELYGKRPQGEFMADISVEDIIKNIR